MSLTLVGIYPKLEVSEDPEFIFEKDWVVEEDFHPNEHGRKAYSIRKNGIIKKQFFERFTTPEFFALSDTKWILRKSSAYLGFHKIEGENFSYFQQYSDLHITEKFTYVVKKGSLSFFDFERCQLQEIIIPNKLRNNFSVSFCKKFIILTRKHSYVYVHDQNLPETFSDEMLAIFKETVREFKSSPKQILVHFKDISTKIKTERLEFFQSEYIDDQLKNSKDEIFLNIDFKDFSFKNRKTLDFLKSNRIREFYKKDILTQLTS